MSSYDDDDLFSDGSLNKSYSSVFDEPLEDTNTVLSCAQKLVESNEKVLNELDRERKERLVNEDVFRDTVINLEKQNSQIISVLKDIQNVPQTCRGSITRTQGGKTEQKLGIDRDVSLQVRGTYNELLENGDIKGWNTKASSRFKDNQNQVVTKKVIEEVQGQFPDFTTGDIKNSCSRYFVTLKQKERRKDSLVEDRKKQRQRQRLIRKLNRRKSTLQTLLEDEPERFEKLNKVLIVDLMSSEESDDEESFIVHPLSWRSQKYKNFVENLDGAGSKKMSVKAKRMRSTRTQGTISESRALSCKLTEYVNMDC